MTSTRSLKWDRCSLRLMLENLVKKIGERNGEDFAAPPQSENVDRAQRLKQSAIHVMRDHVKVQPLHCLVE